MRNLRRYLAIVLAIAMVAVGMAPAAFAAADYSEQAKALYDLDLYKGLSETEFVPDLESTLDRQTGAVMLLRMFGLEEMAKDMGYTEARNVLNEKFSDAAEVADWAVRQVAYATQQGVINGFPDGTFRPDGLLTGRQFCTLVLKQLGYEVADFNKAGAQFGEVAGLTFAQERTFDQEGAITKDLLVGISFTTLTAPMANGEGTLADKLVKDGMIDETKAEDLGVYVPVVEEPEEEPEEPATTEEAVEEPTTTEEAVEEPTEPAMDNAMEAQLTSEDTVVVTFAEEVVSPEAVMFTLEDTVEVELEVTWNEENTVATLVAPSYLLEGTYTLTVEGANLPEGENVATLVVVENGVAKIEIVSENLVLEDEEPHDFATVMYKVYDKYGTDITDETYASDITVAGSVSVSDFTVDTDTGKITIDFANNLEDGDTVAITIIATDTGVAVSQALPVSEEAQVSTITLGDITYPDDDTTKLLVNDGEAGYILVTALDQYGVLVDDVDEFNGEVLFVSSNSNVSLEAVSYEDDDEVDQIKLKVITTGLTDNTTAVVTVVAKLNGASDTKTLTIVEASGADEVKLGSAEGIVAKGDGEEELVVPVYAYDQDGVALSAEEIADETGFDVDGSGAFENSDLQIATSGDNKGKIVNTSDIGTDNTGVIMITSPTGDVATLTISLEDEAYAKVIKVDSAPATNLLMGATTEMDYVFYDQYGREIDGPDDQMVKLTISESDRLALTVAGITTSTSITVTADALDVSDAVSIGTGSEEGTVKITARLYNNGDNSDQVLSKVDTNLEVTEGVPGDLTFAIEDIDTLYAAASETAVDGTSAYARPIVITATDANGETFALPTDRILAVTVSDSDLIHVSSEINTTSGGIEDQRDHYVVAAMDQDGAGFDTDVETFEATVKVTISTDDGVQEVTKTVTVTNDEPEVVEVMFAHIPDLTINPFADGDANPYELDSDTEVLDEVVGDLEDITSQSIYLFTLDQYGVYTEIEPTPAAIDLTVVNADRFDTGSHTLQIQTNNTISDFSAAHIEEDVYVYVMYQADNGVYSTFRMKSSTGDYNAD